MAIASRATDGRSMADFYALPDADIFAKTRPFHAFIQDLKAQGHFQYRRTLLGPSANRVTVWDEEQGRRREMIMMASNNYLGLTTHPRVIEAAERACREYGAGAGSVSLLAGTLELHRRLEERLAAFKACEDAIIFPAGYSANVGCVMGLAREGDLVVNDILNHASIMDGCRLSSATVKAFPHGNVGALDRLLARARDRYAGKLVIVDGVFSMDGDIAPLPKLIEVCRRHGARLMIDEAHATGVIGPNGRGTPAHHRVEGQVDLVAGTLSKALGTVGGFVAASREVVNYLRFYARSYMFSTALPPAVAASVLAGLDVLEEEPGLLTRLWENVAYMRENLVALGFELGNQQTAIFPLIIGDDFKVKEMGRLLHEAGIYANPVFYPAVSRRLSRVRLSLMATHTRQDLDLTLEACAAAGKRLGIV
ncbi:MAG: aminotransferase class I/II-fold pyridoxal phosphate-dependent enzyme [bacterium]|nr:aminotransferase class I/II-fold pyridoxal phosphate-dependent enzyme [bacterium]